MAGELAGRLSRPLRSVVLPIPVLRDAAAGARRHELAARPRPDRAPRAAAGAHRATPCMPSLALEALRVAQGASTYVLRASNASGTTSFGRRPGLNRRQGRATVEIATSADGSIRPRYTPSAPDALHVGRRSSGRTGSRADEMRGRVIFVGTTAIGLGDVRATPLDAVVPGVEIHAQVLEQLLAGKLLSRPDWALGRRDRRDACVCCSPSGRAAARVAPLARRRGLAWPPRGAAVRRLLAGLRPRRPAARPDLSRRSMIAHGLSVGRLRALADGAARQAAGAPRLRQVRVARPWWRGSPKTRSCWC